MTLIENINDIITCLTQAANKLRTLSGSSAKILPEDIATEIQNVYDSKTPNLQSKTYTPTDPNNDVVLTPDEGYDGFDTVTIAPAVLQVKGITPTQSVQHITADNGYYALKDIYVNGAVLKSNFTVKSDTQTGSIAIYDPRQKHVYGFGYFEVEPVLLQDKTVTPTEEQQIITADSGYDALGTVTVVAARLTPKIIRVD